MGGRDIEVRTGARALDGWALHPANWPPSPPSREIGTTTVGPDGYAELTITHEGDK